MMLSKNPYTEKIIKNYNTCDKHKTIELINNAQKSFDKWKSIDINQRAKIIQIIQSNLESKKLDCAKIITEEMGKPIKESIAEIDKCIWLCDYYVKNGPEILKDELIETDAKKSYVSFEPLGVILGIMPWNFPFWQVFRFVIPSILSGNITMVKHASNVSLLGIPSSNVIS